MADDCGSSSSLIFFADSTTHSSGSILIAWGHRVWWQLLISEYH
jgi:hypothetical protein